MSEIQIIRIYQIYEIKDVIPNIYKDIMLDLGTISKKNLDYIYYNNPELENIGTKEQYSNYLKTIFPNSKLQDIYFHRTKTIERFDTFDKKFRKKFGDFGGDAFYFAPLKYVKKVWDKTQLTNATDTIYAAKLNIQNPYISPDDVIRIDKNSVDWEKTNEKYYYGVRNKTYDSIVDYYDDKPPYRGKIPLQILVYESEQIHMLGTNADKTNFKNFINLTKEINEIKKLINSII